MTEGALPEDADEDREPSLSCGHEPAVAYEVGFVVRDGVDDVEEIGSACDMRATVHECDVEDANADAVGCGVASCENYHERVAEERRRDAARHSGTVRAGDEDAR